jgi:replication factor A1
MINIPFETVIKKLKDHGLSDEEISAKIKQKMEQLSGLISKEGAAHIIANELGIKLIDKTSGRLKIKDMLSGMRNIEAVGKVTTVFDVRTFARQDGTESKVGSFIMGDETGTIRVTCWGSSADYVAKITKDNIVKITSSYIKNNQGRNELHLNDNSKLIINPPGENIGDISLESRQFDRKKVDELNETMQNVELLGTVVGVDALRFFEVCPKCEKRLKLKREEYECEQHGLVAASFSYVMNMILDDNTSSIRVVCFRDMVEKSLKIDRPTLLALKDSADLTSLKNALLGTIIKVKGRVKRNQMFDRLEFACQDIDIKPDPYEEMVQLDSEIEQAKAKNEVASIDEI